MLKLILVFAIITVVHCDPKCPDLAGFDGYLNQNDIRSKILGNYSTVYTTGYAPVMRCNKVECIEDANGDVNCQIKSPGCCVQQYDFVFNANQADYKIGPIPGYVEQCPYVENEDGSTKLVATYGSGSTQCIIMAVCQELFSVVNVACRGSTRPPLFVITLFLNNVLALLGLSNIPVLEPVTQDCGEQLPPDTCPPFGTY